MGIFNKIEDQFEGVKKELKEEYSALSRKTINDFDKITDKMAENKIMNATIFLTANQESEDENDISLKGGIMGKSKDLVGLLGEAMIKDSDLKKIVKKAFQYAENANSLNSSESSVHAMAIGPNGEKFDINELPDDIKDSLREMMENDLSKKTRNNKSKAIDLLDEFKEGDDTNQFNDDINELNDEDF